MSEAIGGYRLVRRLGEGERAQVYLGASQRDADAETVAIKVYRESMSHTAILTEAEALARAQGGHVVRLLDVATTHDGAPALVLERVSGGSLARVLRHRDRLGAGEAITVLAPVAEALLRLHSAGVAHGGVAAERVLFTPGGEPLLACFGAAVLADPAPSPVVRIRDLAIRNDVAAFTRLAQVLLARVSTGDRCQVPSSPGAEDDPHETLHAWLTMLFRFAEAAPVDLVARSTVQALEPARIPASQANVHDELDRRHALSAIVMPEWIEQLLHRVAPRIAHEISRVRGSVRKVRRRVWVLAIAVIIALATALVLVQPGDGPEPASDVEDIVVEGSGTDEVEEVDPVSAALALLSLREQCLRDRSVLCLDEVGQSGSAALAGDQQLVRALQAGEESPEPISVVANSVRLVERLGDSALVALGDVDDHEPASLLLMLSDAGWRIRAYLER